MKRHWRKLIAGFLIATVSLTCLPFLANVQAASRHERDHDAIHHVLLLSIDGMHAQDLARYIRIHPDSTLAKLANMGVNYTNASTSKPSDSFPGLLSMVTGGSPRSTGVFYDDSYDRNLSAPGSNCSSKGTEVVYDESIDKNSNALDAGGGIDPAKLPLDPAKGCKPVYPHNFLRVNTIFEVARAAHLRTAWVDKHPAYELLNGPSGKGLDDFYGPEIAANNTTNSVSATEAYDDLKVKAILNQIDGKDSSGSKKVGIPAIFGMNFQAVSVGQKLPTGGYTDSQGMPSTSLEDAFAHTDQSLGKMVSKLSQKKLLSSTQIIVTAKHGQAPIDPNKLQLIGKNVIPDLINSVQKGLLAQATQDDISLIWLTDSSKVNDVVAKLSANEAQANIQEILAGDSLKLLFNDPQKDSRTPDIVVIPNQGVIYAGKNATKIAEHGGFNEQDIHVPLLIANPELKASNVYTPVQTTQIAPTILDQLGLRSSALQAVRQEHTQTLPGLAEDKGK